MRYLIYFNESVKEENKLGKLVTFPEMKSFIKNKKEEKITTSDYHKIITIVNRPDLRYYRKLDVVEIEVYNENDDSIEQVILQKYEDDWWVAIISIPYGITTYFILDTLDGLVDVKINDIDLVR